jgi:transposase-like protein
MRYSDEQRQAALDCLAANEGDFRRTSAETGIAVRTLRKWARGEQFSGAELAGLKEELTAYQQFLEDSERPDDVLHRAGIELMLSMIDDAILVSEHMETAIPDAPLNQLAAALGQLIDKILRLSKELPRAGEQVIRIEFIDADGTTHQTPYWARNHTGEPDSV